MDQSIYSDIQCFIVDMDGTFYLGDELLDGALDFAKAVKEKGKRFFFFTNNSSHEAGKIAEKLNRLGYPAGKDDIIISSHVCIDFIKRNRPGKTVYLLGNENMTADFVEAGIPFDDENPDIVVLGFDTTLTYEKIRKAALFIADGKEYIATHPDKNCPMKDGFMLDTGSMIAMFAASTGREPDLIMGKPGCKREEIAFVGDRLETDIAIGSMNGLKTALVYTGVTSPELYEKSEIRATGAFKSLGELSLYI